MRGLKIYEVNTRYVKYLSNFQEHLFYSTYENEFYIANADWKKKHKKTPPFKLSYLNWKNWNVKYFKVPDKFFLREKSENNCEKKKIDLQVISSFLEWRFYSHIHGRFVL